MPLSTKLAAGKLRHRIEIVQPSGAQDSFGGVSQDPSLWTKVLTCFASINAQSGRDQMAASEYTSVSTHTIVIRDPRTLTITNAMYVWFKGRTFQITAVLNPDERNKMLYIMCVEVNNSTQQTATPATGLR